MKFSEMLNGKFVNFDDFEYYLDEKIDKKMGFEFNKTCYRFLEKEIKPHFINEVNKKLDKCFDMMLSEVKLYLIRKFFEKIKEKYKIEQHKKFDEYFKELYEELQKDMEI